jgi:hypothetical protein
LFYFGRKHPRIFKLKLRFSKLKSMSSNLAIYVHRQATLSTERSLKIAQWWEKNPRCRSGLSFFPITTSS